MCVCCISPYNSVLATAWVCFGLFQMTRYKQAEFEDDSSSVGSVQLTEGVSATTTHIRYHTVSAAQFVNICKLYTWHWHFSWRLLYHESEFMYCIYKIIIICILLSRPIVYCVCCYFNDKLYIHCGGSLEYWMNEWMNEWLHRWNSVRKTIFMCNKTCIVRIA